MFQFAVLLLSFAEDERQLLSLETASAGNLFRAMFLCMLFMT